MYEWIKRLGIKRDEVRYFISATSFVLITASVFHYLNSTAEVADKKATEIYVAPNLSPGAMDVDSCEAGLFNLDITGDDRLETVLDLSFYGDWLRVLVERTDSGYKLTPLDGK